ncbi:aromatic acid exporter family protein [Streptomyces pathocidini]|uniref:Aromatic acid exporter family protein n=1 Tax=Streptomyces pathocidini TaxID=1650571 RepID=A0ABW7UTE2_9ACTN|nr:aromatic acid exporter family protein [Streptomyces pathocidini]
MGTVAADSIVDLARKVNEKSNEPIVVQTVRCTVGATLAYAAAEWFINAGPPPLLAPLTALLVVQVSLYATLTTGFRRINSVIAGVLIASAFSTFVGLSWWSLGLLIGSALILGHLVRVDEFVPEVAISAMLVLGVSHVAAMAWDRVGETLIGAACGILLNLVIAPPVYVEPAGQAIAELARDMRALLMRMSRELEEGARRENAVRWLHQARGLDDDVAGVDAALNRADESMRFNPRVREGLLARLVLRSGLDTLEICCVVLRTLCRSLTDLSHRRRAEPVYEGEVAGALSELFTHLADAVDSFGRLITAQVSTNAEAAEGQLAEALENGRADRDRIAELLRIETEREPDRWELHGALLANVDRILNELDVERRSQWLAEELDRHRQDPGKPSPTYRVRRVVRRAKRKVRGLGKGR